MYPPIMPTVYKLVNVLLLEERGNVQEVLEKATYRSLAPNKCHIAAIISEHNFVVKTCINTNGAYCSFASLFAS